MKPLLPALLVFLFLAPHAGKAQSATIADIQALNAHSWELRAAKPDSAVLLATQALRNSQQIAYAEGKAKSLSYLGFYAFFQGEGDSATARLSRALTAIKAANVPNEQAKVHNKLGYVLHQLGRLDSAIAQYKLALPLATDTLVRANSLNNLGVSYRAAGESAKAIEHYVAALDCYKQLNRTQSVARTQVNIGALYFYQDDLPKSLQYLKPACKLAEEINDALGLANARINLANSYKALDSLEKAQQLYTVAYDWYASVGAQKEAAICLSNCGQIHQQQGEKQAAAQRFRAAKKIFSSLQAERELAGVYHNLGWLHGETQPDSALWYYHIAQKMAASVGDPDLEMEIALALATTYEQQQQHEQALHWHTRHTVLKDSLHALEKARQLAEVEAAYRNQELSAALNEQDNALKQSRAAQLLAWGGFAAAMLLLALLGMLGWRKSQQAKRLAAARAEALDSNEALRSQLHEREQQIAALQAKLKDGTSTLPKQFGALSKREIEVLLLMADGLTDAQLAETLFISVNTVRTHTKRIYSKLLVRNRTEAVSLLHKHQLS